MNFNAGIGSIPITTTTYASPNSSETSNSQRETTHSVRLPNSQPTLGSMDNDSLEEDLLAKNSSFAEWKSILEQDYVDNLPFLHSENDQDSSGLLLDEVNIDNLPLSLRYVDDVDDLPDPLTVTTTALSIISTLRDPITETAESETENAGKAKVAPLIKAHETAVQKKTRPKKKRRVQLCDDERKNVCRMMTINNEICGKSFGKPSELVKHKRIHTGEKPFPCDICEKSFKQKSQLVGHRRIHTKEKPFSCDICNQKSNRKDWVRAHKESKHGKKKSYMCTICDAGFTQKCNLINHMRTHTGEKPYVCNICKKSFSQSGSLTKHRKTIHQIEFTVTQTELLTQT